MFDDTFNPLGMQDGSVHPPHERTFFVTSKLRQWTKFRYYFQIKSNIPLVSAHALMTHFEL